MNPPAIRFHIPPVIGTALMLAGQRYELRAVEPHRRRDGARTVILTWGSHCAQCGAPFSVTTGLSVVNLNRRCARHHAPGKAVVERKVVWPRRAIAGGAQ